MSIKNPRTRIFILLLWAGSFLAFDLYARISHIGTGQWIILGGLILIFLALVGIVLSLHEEMGRAGKDPWPIGDQLNETDADLTGLNGLYGWLFNPKQWRTIDEKPDLNRPCEI